MSKRIIFIILCISIITIFISCDPPSYGDIIFENNYGVSSGCYIDDVYQGSAGSFGGKLVITNVPYGVHSLEAHLSTTSNVTRKVVDLDSESYTWTIIY